MDNTCYKCGNPLEADFTVETCPICARLLQEVRNYHNRAIQAQEDGDVQTSMYFRRLALGD